MGFGIVVSRATLEEERTRYGICYACSIESDTVILYRIVAP